ncbi:MAG: aspartate aminotransferase family protein [Saprospiraceae bacterium]|nr:aspartate aminotransferase family protein [Saprospiraceae bacterium]
MRTLFLKHLAPTSEMPLMIEIERAEGIYLIQKNGEKIIDMISGIAVSSLGHLNPAIKKAVHDQVDAYWHTMVYGEFVLSPQVKLASLISDHLPGNLDSVYFTNSGSEATEGAMKLAKRATGRAEIISASNAYHGSTQGAASLMWPTTFTQAFHPLLPGTSHIQYNNFEDLEKISRQTAAVIIEAVQGEAGVVAPVEGYLEAVREKCTETGTLLIIDEAQTGFGRTGKTFAIEHSGIQPDMVLLAKALGGGFPLGAFVASKDLMKHLAFDPPLGHITTFGGHPVCTAAGLAAFEYLLENRVVEQVDAKATLIKKHIQHPAIRSIRNVGLMFALEIGSFEKVFKVVKAGLEQGILVDWFLFNSDCIRLAPPLIISEEEIKLACEKLKTAMDVLLD